MIFTKKASSDALQCNIYLNGNKLIQVEHYKYLGCTLSWNCQEDMTFKSRFLVLNCYIYQIFTYCSETWNISKAMESQIQAFEMWCFRHMQRISWRAKKSNENVLRQIGHNTRLLKSIKMRQMKFLGHVIRKEKLEHLFLTGLIP